VGDSDPRRTVPHPGGVTVQITWPMLLSFGTSHHVGMRLAVVYGSGSVALWSILLGSLSSALALTRTATGRDAAVGAGGIHSNGPTIFTSLSLPCMVRLSVSAGS